MRSNGVGVVVAKQYLVVWYRIAVFKQSINQSIKRSTTVTKKQHSPQNVTSQNTRRRGASNNLIHCNPTLRLISHLTQQPASQPIQRQSANPPTQTYLLTLRRTTLPQSETRAANSSNHDVSTPRAASKREKGRGKKKDARFRLCA